MRDPFEMSLWKDIIKGGKDFSLKLAVRLSNDRLERFWWDRFTREFKLKDASLTLLIIAFLKNAIVYGMEEVKVAVGRLD